MTLSEELNQAMVPCCVELASGNDNGYIANFKSNEVTVFEKKTGNTIATIPAGDHPSYFVVLTDDSRYLLIGHESTDGLWFMDTRTNQIIKKLTQGTGYLCKDTKGKKIEPEPDFHPIRVCHRS